jgi:hypothetical protein
MCSNCSAFNEVVYFHSPDVFHDHVDRVLREVDTGKLTLGSGNVDLNSLQRGRNFPDDFIDLTFICSTCGGRFSLGGVVYSGRNVKWQPL